MATSILYVVLTFSGANFKSDYTIGNEKKSVVLTGKKATILKQFDTIYQILENKNTQQAKQLQGAVAELSKMIVEPAAELIGKTDHINFVIDKSLVRCAFDLLEVRGKPLFLTHAISYSAYGYRAQNPSLKAKGGYFVADPTTDPEDGFKTASARLAGSRWEAVEDSSLEEIGKGGEYNILAISAHGDLDKSNSGSMGINEEELNSDLMENIDVALAYFDSCQMGANWDFVEVFHSEKSATFMVAPIISNDAGDSSTLTVTWFFENLAKSKNTAAALRNTRVKLYEYYSKKRLDPVTVLNKAFCFRLYEFRRALP